MLGKEAGIVHSVAAEPEGQMVRVAKWVLRVHRLLSPLHWAVGWRRSVSVSGDLPVQHQNYLFLHLSQNYLTWNSIISTCYRECPPPDLKLTYSIMCSMMPFPRFPFPFSSGLFLSWGWEAQVPQCIPRWVWFSCHSPWILGLQDAHHAWLSRHLSGWCLG